MKKPEKRNIKSMMMGAPVPGQSLASTSDPGDKPWERAPELNTVDEVAEFYIERLNQPAQIKKLIFVLENGIPVRPLVESILTSGVSKGVHNVDLSLLVAPILHEQVVAIAEEAGIEFDEGLEDPEEAELDTQIDKARLYKELKGIQKEHGGKSAKPPVMENPEPEEMPEEEVAEMPVKRGLGARRT